MAETTHNGRRQACAMLGIHALTALHPGSGTALGTVDLPVQRERHTTWPTIAGSALKGVLRDAVRENLKGAGSRSDANKHEDVVAIFGPADDAEAAGALSITDARLVAYPVRSLKGVFAWVSCNAVLERLKRDAELAGFRWSWNVPNPVKEHAIAQKTSPCWVGDSMILEEFEFKRTEGDAPLLSIAMWLAESLIADADTRKRFPQQLVLLPDDWFTHFARHATEISARIALDPDTKTVKPGALFYQEFLPTESLFSAVCLMNSARTRKDAGKPTDLLAKLQGNLPPVLQIGGDETTGKGYCAIKMAAGGNGNG